MTESTQDIRAEISARGITGLTADIVEHGLNAGKVDFFTLDRYHTDHKFGELKDKYLD